MNKDTKDTLEMAQENHHHHHHMNGRRCCGRLISERCSPEERAANTDPETGHKSCCKGSRQ